MIRFLLLLMYACSLHAVTVATAHYDNTRNGSNTQETVLTPSNVAGLIKLGSYTLDGPLYNQPLYIPSVTISSAVHNVVIAATMNNTVYALDADVAGASPLWSTNFGAGWATYCCTGGLTFYGQTIGILSTPVVDVSGGFVYVVTVNSSGVYTLRKLSLATGTQASSVNVSGSNGGATFSSTNQSQRTPLTLANGNIYFGFGSMGEGAGSHWKGWVFAYDAASLSQVAVLCLEPTGGDGAGVWQSGGGLAVDNGGSLYFSTGNGTYDGVSNFGQTILKVNSSLVIQDWFTPSNNATTSAEDADISSGRVMLIPGTTKLTIGSKDGRVWLIDTTDMGHLQGGGGTAPQVFNTASIPTPSDFTGIFGGLFFGNVGYFPVNANPMYSFTFGGSTYTTTPLATTSANFNRMTLTGTSNAGASPIVWALTVDTSPFGSPKPVTLRAFNASTSVEYWNSGTVIGNYAKFAAPTVANGRAYVPTNDGTIVAFGLPTKVNLRGPVNVRSGVTFR